MLHPSTMAFYFFLQHIDPPTWNSAIWSSLNCGAIFFLSLCNVPSIISIAKLRRREILELGKHKSTDRGEWEIQRLQLYVLLLSSESISENWPVPVLEIIISFIQTENCVCGSKTQLKPTLHNQLRIPEAARSTLPAPRGGIENWFVLIIICFPTKLLLQPPLH